MSENHPHLHLHLGLLDHRRHLQRLQDIQQVRQ
jgi:hypothetical protein